MKHLLSLLFLLSSVTSYCQDFSFANYDFDDKEIEIPAEYKDQNELVLLLNRKIELVSSKKSVDQYYLHHEKVWVNSDEAIERNNKIYISFGYEDEFYLNKNRVLLPNGKIIELKDSDIHEETDSESGRSYKYYAVNGLEKGAIIEKLYIKREAPYLSGRRYNFQFSVPVLSTNFQLIHPSHLKFMYKSYNGLTEATENDSLLENKIVVEIAAQNIPAANLDEKMSNSRIHIKGFRYKLFENSLTGAWNFFNYANFGKGFHERLNTKVKKKTHKKLKKFFSKINKTSDIGANLLAIEHHIKTNIAFNSNYKENTSLKDVIESKQSDIFWLLKLYQESLRLYDIKTDIVLTTNRFEKEFDLEFETTDNLVDALIYIPELDQYLDPQNKSLRSPLYNYSNGNHHGLKISEIDFGGTTMAITETVFIPLPGMEITSDTMDITVDFSEEIDNPFVVSALTFGGYAGANLQAIKDLVPPDQYKEILLDICKNYAADVKLEKNEPINDGLDNMGKKPFGLDIEFHAQDLVQLAGNKILFQLGKIIGKQTEMYQTEERMFPVESTYPHHYTRKIKILLPDGYQVSNPEVINLDFETILDEKLEAKFISTYEIVDNTLTINNTEYYKRVDFPLESFKNYQSVINAAADFNKIVLVLEKK